MGLEKGFDGEGRGTYKASPYRMTWKVQVLRAVAEEMQKGPMGGGR